MQDAEDAKQDTFLRAFVHLRQYDGRSEFYTWLTLVTINSSLILLRRKRTRRETPFEFASSSDDVCTLLEFEKIATPFTSSDWFTSANASAPARAANCTAISRGKIIRYSECGVDHPASNLNRIVTMPPHVAQHLRELLLAKQHFCQTRGTSPAKG